MLLRLKPWEKKIAFDAKDFSKTYLIICQPSHKQNTFLSTIFMMEHQNKNNLIKPI